MWKHGGFGLTTESTELKKIINTISKSFPFALDKQ